MAGRTSGIDTSGKASDVGKALLDDRGHKRAIAEALVDSSKRITKQSRQKLGGRPGGGLYKREPSGIESARMRGGAGILVKGGGTMLGAEFGMSVHYVFGRPVKQASMKRRVMPTPIRTAKKTEGYVVGQTIKDTMKETQEDVRDAVLTELAKDLKSAGAKVRKRF